MVKVCVEDYPLGSYKGQEEPGMYIDGFLKNNIDVLARNIIKDQQFVGLISGDGTVRNGKSTVAQQIGKYYSYAVSKATGRNIPFDINNIVFKAGDLFERARTLPQYSCLILDEGDDLTAHYFSELTKQINRFFRKSGQLNLFIILILPEFFELKRPLAMNRSNFLVNVKFWGEFERGVFDFYGPRNKRLLYLLGKKMFDYNPKGVHKDFQGRFINLYTVDEKAYREAKYRDLLEDEKETKTIAEIEAVAKATVALRLYKMLTEKYKVTKTDFFKALPIAKQTFFQWIRKYNLLEQEGVVIGNE